MQERNTNPVQIKSIKVNDCLGYDIHINDTGSTVHDYINALEHFINMSDLSRERGLKKNGRQGECKGCYQCCGERIPLVLTDLAAMGSAFGQEDFLEILQRCGFISVEGNMVDITLPLNSDGLCFNLDRETKTCSIYPQRPLTCRTYICCPATRKARQLRSAVINAGEDALVRYWLQKRKGGESFADSCDCHEAFEPCPIIEDYMGPVFDSLAQVRLRDLCTPGLWRRLTEGGER